MQVTADLVKALRERTGAGMMECKKALNETGGDMDQAIELMRKSGQAKAVKKEGRVAAEGRIALAADDSGVAMVEINTETDFAAKDDNLVAFADDVADCVLQQAPADVELLSGLTLGKAGVSVEDARQGLVAKIGENIQVRRFVRFVAGDAQVAHYLHGARIGVCVALQGPSPELARDIAMHIAATRPQFLSSDDVPAQVLEQEKEILIAQAADSGKPPEIIEKMVQGRLQKHLAEITLVGQPFVKDPDQTVGQLLEAKGASVQRYERLEVGEGKEKEQGNFADEVMAQVKGE